MTAPDPADVELVARVLARRFCRDGRDALVFLDAVAPGGAEPERADARAVLTALAGAGRLLPPDADTRTAALRETYWKLREHASAYRSAKVFQRARERWEANRDDERTYRRYALHEFYAKGIEAAAEDIAEMLGVPEHEIEPAGDPGGGR